MSNCEYFHDVIGELLEALNCHTDRVHSLTGYEAEDMAALACTLKETCFAYKAYSKGKLYEHGIYPEETLHHSEKKE